MMIRERDDAGVVLIALLWVLTALSVIALSFSRETLVEVAAARNTRDLSDAYYVARAGLQQAVYKVIERRYAAQAQGIEQQALAPDPIDLGYYEGTFGGGTFRVDIQDESGKINVNFINEDQLRTLAEVIGIQRPDSDVIVDSVMDWRDADRAHRANGAEDDYYQQLPTPYKSKNGRLDTVEELLLVRGVTREYYYGYREKAQDGSPGYRFGLSRYLTVYTNSNRVNVNFAELPVLMAIPGMNANAAQQIYERRKSKPFKTVQEITTELPVMLDTTTLPYLSTDAASVFTMTASARMVNSKVQRIIRAVVTVGDSREPSLHRILYWNENVANL